MAKQKKLKISESEGDSNGDTEASASRCDEDKERKKKRRKDFLDDSSDVAAKGDSDKERKKQKKKVKGKSCRGDVRKKSKKRRRYRCRSSSGSRSADDSATESADDSDSFEMSSPKESSRIKDGKAKEKKGTIEGFFTTASLSTVGTATGNISASSSSFFPVTDPQKVVNLVIKVDKDTAIYTYAYQLPSQLSWHQFESKLKTSCRIGISDIVKIQYLAKYEDREKPEKAHLFNDNFSTFKCYASVRGGLSIDILITTTRGEEQARLLTQRLANRPSTLQRIDQRERESNFSKELQRLKDGLTLSSAESLSNLLSSQDIRKMAMKRRVVEVVYGNGNLLLNPLQIQCPICGKVISIGHFNEVGTSKDHLVDHLKTHSTKTAGALQKCMAALLDSRVASYFNANRTFEAPMVESCDEGVHQFVKFEAPGNSVHIFGSKPGLQPKPDQSIGCGCGSDCENPIAPRYVTPAEWRYYAFKVFPCIQVKSTNMKYFIPPNTELLVVDGDDVTRNGLLVSPHVLHPAFVVLQELINRGELLESHPFLQEIEYFSHMFGDVSDDPVRGMNEPFTQYQGLMYLQQRMRDAKTGREAYNIYLGRHNTGKGESTLGKKGKCTLPDVRSVFHFGLSPAGWLRNEVVPAINDGVLVSFLLTLLEIVPLVTKVKTTGIDFSTTYVNMIFDGKGVSPGAEVYDGNVAGVSPVLDSEDIDSLCADGYPAMLKKLIQNFLSKVTTWVKEVEVHMVHLLDITIAVPVACYSYDHAGKTNDAEKRIKEVLLYVNSCDNCLIKSVNSGQPPKCIVSCRECFVNRALCDNHKDVYTTWIDDERPCDQCVREGKCCNRFKVIITTSDSASTYTKYGKEVSGTFTELLEGSMKGPYHIHDINHNIKNAEASLENGTHFDGQFSYDSTDLSVMLATVDGEQYQKMNAGVSHKSILQFDKQSDEAALQRCSLNVTEVASDVGFLLKTEIPETQRPWFAPDHGKMVEKPFFLAISNQSGLVFCSDNFNQSVYVYRQSTLPRQVRLIGKKLEGDAVNDPLLGNPVFASTVDSKDVVWKNVGGMSFIKNDMYLLVADLGFGTVRVISGIKKSKRGETLVDVIYPVSDLRSLPNLRLRVHSLKIGNRLNMVPCAMCEINNGMVAITDPVNKCVEIIEFHREMKSATSLRTINSGSFIKPFDITTFKLGKLLLTDIGSGAGDGSIHVISINADDVQSFSSTVNPWGVCVLNETVIVSDKDQHAVFRWDLESNEVTAVIGSPNSPGIKDGPLDVASLTSPIGLATRGSSIYIAEHPDDLQGSVRVLRDLEGLVNFKNILRSVSMCFGMISRREKVYLAKSNHLPKTSYNLRELADELPKHASKLKDLKERISQLHSSNGLDITYGFMSSQTAEAIFDVMIKGVEYLMDYFTYIGKPELLTCISSKCLTTRLNECFFGHIMLGVQGNNMRHLEFIRRVVNDAFHFLLPYVNSASSGVSIRSEKEKDADSYSYSQHDFKISSGTLLWKLLASKRKSMLLVGQKLKLKNHNLVHPDSPKKSGFCFGRVDKCTDYMDLVKDITPSMKVKYREVTTALKSRPMKSLRGTYYKRKYGTAPTVLGAHYIRSNLEKSDGSLSIVMMEGNQDSHSINENHYALEVNDCVIFYPSDGFDFNVIQIKSNYLSEELKPNTKIYGDFLMPTEDEGGDVVNFYMDENWRGGSMDFKYALLDEDDHIITANFDLLFQGNTEPIYCLPREVYNSIADLVCKGVTDANFYEQIDRESEVEEDVNDEGENDEEDSETEACETQPVQHNRRERKGRGNRLPVLFRE